MAKIKYYKSKPLKKEKFQNGELFPEGTARISPEVIKQKMAENKIAYANAEMAAKEVIITSSTVKTTKVHDEKLLDR